MKKQISLLCTRPLTDAVIAKAPANDIQIHTLSFIETRAVITPELSEQIREMATKQYNVVITSMNAAEAVIHELKKDLSVPAWHIYTMGGGTKSLICDYWNDLSDIIVANDASSLADKIIEENPIEVTFFCGNIRRNDLPVKLNNALIKVEEVVVYETTHTPHKVDAAYDGILFFSPSAVESFFSANGVASQTVLFAIGSTTAEAITRFSNNKIVTGNAPGKGELVEKAVAYFAAL